MQICQYCRSDISKSQEVIQCDKCGAYYHRNCWFSLGGCATLGCENNPYTLGYELRELEKKGVQYELLGKWWDALQIYYQIKKIDPSFPRVDIKIDELEKEYAKTKLPTTSIICHICGTSRSSDLLIPCPNCGSRKTIFGQYFRPNEIRKFRTMLAVAIGLTILGLITIAILLSYLFPQFIH